ncbi:hypothetical protein FDECE_14367 [Fusarium decemcellulare]|nr:hypothetical protein FDECE_14367 [Fusarium decemcellulare]
MLSIPRLPQQQHQHQHNSSNSQQYPYSQDCQSEYHPAIYSDFSRTNYDDELAAFSHQLPTDLMQPEAWGALAQQTPRLSRAAHQRESSLSSLGSSTAGPASPFTHNTSNPQIAITDAHDQTGSNSSYYHLAKSMAPYSGYQTCGGIDHAMPEMAYPSALSGPSGKPRMDRGMMHVPDFSNGSTRSHPTSVASSIAGDSPATPTVGEIEHSDRRRKGTGSLFDGGLSDERSQFLFLGYPNAPKLDRTMTDVYADELYSPNFAVTSTPLSQTQMAVSPTNDVFNQRLHAANSQHLSAAHSPASSTSRDRSPFRAGSPLAPSPAHDFGNAAFSQNLPFNSAQRMREHNKAQQDAQFMQQQMSQRHEPETPKTISPKDAILEFNEPEGESNFPLFPQGSSGFEMDHFKGMVGHGSQDPSMHDANANGHFNFLPSQAPSGIPVPQQYPFIAHSRPSHETPPRLSSAGSSSNESRNTTPATRPSSTAAEGGTYTCTYHGCTLRFETPTLLQKHKREGHRQTQALGSVRPRDMGGMTSNLLNSQAGPHRCDRINPSTGKPCNTIFSRPYDLTRHEDTIHNARKQKVRCDLCTEEKTFSRADALTRHYRVCHPDVELPGKHRRRGGA